MRRRIATAIAGAFAIFALLFLALEVFAHINSPKTLRTYYRLETKWESKWPLGHDILTSIEPAMEWYNFKLACRTQGGCWDSQAAQKTSAGA